jgi:ligand-binding SRPBCC domain-containing protein
MPTIYLETPIEAAPTLVFDLARSIDLHTVSTKATNERAIAGVTSGLINLGESVTWRAKHFGVYQTLTSLITAMEPPHYFVDEMQQGIFKSIHHKHEFEATATGTLMRDIFAYQAPLGPLGRLADGLFLEAYMRRFLEQRNLVIKETAESGRWRELLEEPQ